MSTATKAPTRPTAPLPPAAAAALARLERSSIAPAVVRAVTVYEVASVRAMVLAGFAETGFMSDLDADSLAHAEDLMAGSRAILADAGQLHLLADEHGKTKDPQLPQRPRGPHPQSAAKAGV